jgi:hypothetical protein
MTMLSNPEEHSMASTDAVPDDAHEPVLSPVDRVCELCFGLLMALTFVGAVSATTDDPDPGRVMFYTALGCNLAWGLADGVIHLVRTLTERARRLRIATAVRAEADPARGVATLRGELDGVMRTLVDDVELEAVRQRMRNLSRLPAAGLDRRDYGAAVAIFALVTLGTFPVALPFLVLEPGPALLVSRVLTLAMLFACGIVLGRYAGSGGWKAGLGMTVLGVVLTAAIIALGG